MQELWRGKVYVPAAGPAAAQLGWRQRYADSLADAARTQLRGEELTAFPWLFRRAGRAGMMLSAATAPVCICACSCACAASACIHSRPGRAAWSTLSLC